MRLNQIILALIYRTFFLAYTHTHVHIGTLVSPWAQVKFPIRWMIQFFLDANPALLDKIPVLPRVAFVRQKDRLRIERDMYLLFTALLCILPT